MLFALLLIMKSKQKIIALIISILFLTPSLHTHADELIKGTHGGSMAKHLKTGLAYEVVRKSKEVYLYPPSNTSPVPSTITIGFKNEKGMMDRVELKLLPVNEPGSVFYSAPLPERVLVAAGLTFYFN